MAPSIEDPALAERQRVVVRTWQYAIGDPKRVYWVETFGETITSDVMVSF